MPGTPAGKIIDPDVVKSILGDTDLRGGVCATSDPLIWSGEWCDMAGGSKAARQVRWKKMRKAVRLCKTCPILADCEKQLKAFEDAGCRVTGVMAARQWGQRSEEDRITECRMCHRPMHPRVHGVAAPVVPDGHVIVQCRGLCATCYSRAKKAGTLDQTATPSHPGNHRGKTLTEGTAA